PLRTPPLFPYTTLFRSASGTELERELMRKAVRGLRTTPEAFTDDGPRKARQVLTRLQPLLAEGEKEVLERAAAVAPGSTFADLRSEEHTSELQSPYDLV